MPNAEKDAHFLTTAQGRLLTEFVDVMLRDVFQGKRENLREHLLGVAAKVSRKHPWPYFEECVEAEVQKRLATRVIPPAADQGGTDA